MTREPKFHEPWEVDHANWPNGNALLHSRGVVIAAIGDSRLIHGSPDTTADRIASCVNACAHLSDPELAEGVVSRKRYDAAVNDASLRLNRLLYGLRELQIDDDSLYLAVRNLIDAATEATR